MARNWLSNVGLMAGCRARLCATFIEISSRAGTRVFFLFPSLFLFFQVIAEGFLVVMAKIEYKEMFVY